MKAIIEEYTPSNKKYMALSWDAKANRLGVKINKHYRYYINESLENT